MERTPQIDVWSGDFGKEYTNRNPSTLDELNELYIQYFGITRTALNEEFVGKLERSMKILEVGANVGAQLQALSAMGFENLHALELQEYAIEIGKKNLPQVTWTQGTAFEIPYPDNHFDLVYTSSVLIHISPDDVVKVLDQIHRCSQKYIWGYEYFADEWTEVAYRGHDSLLWKTDYAKFYLDRFSDLELVAEKRVPYRGSDNVDTMYLLQKR